MRQVVEVELAEDLAGLAAVGTPFEVVELEELRRIRAARGGHAREDAAPRRTAVAAKEVMSLARLMGGLWNGRGGDAKGRAWVPVCGLRAGDEPL